ncbi:TadE family type IV pilus minor pilin [Arthrobacter psychrolactophilus]
MLLLSASAGMLQLRLEEGARAGARALARGDSSTQVVDIVARVSGHGASVELSNSGGYATVSVSDHVGGVLSAIVPWTQTARASARLESRTARTKTSALENRPQTEILGQKSTKLKATLWRWVISPSCSQAMGRCVTTARGSVGGFHRPE